LIEDFTTEQATIFRPENEKGGKAP